jgi:hypothetical protein
VAGKIATLGGAGIHGVCHEAGVLRWAARRQVAAYRSRADEYTIERDELCAALELALEEVSWEAFGGDEPYEGDPDADDADDSRQGSEP